jgi:hypothetical protein
MIREYPAFDPGWNKIFNITGMIREGLALPASSLALPGTTAVIPGKHRSSAGTNRDDPGYDIADRATVELRWSPGKYRQSPG